MVEDMKQFVQKDTLFDKFGLYDITDVENLQNIVSLILFTAPPIQANGTMGTKLQNELEKYNSTYKKGNVLYCSSLCQSFSGLSGSVIKREKYTENLLKQEMKMNIGASSGSKEYTFKFNETHDLTVFNTFQTIYNYMKCVIRGNCMPSDIAWKNNMLDYVFSVYVINFAPNGKEITSVIKLCNCSVTEVNHDALSFNREQTEQKFTDINIECEKIDVNSVEVAFEEMKQLQILPSDFSYKFKGRKINGTSSDNTLGIPTNFLGVGGQDFTAGLQDRIGQIKDLKGDKFDPKQFFDMASRFGSGLDSIVGGINDNFLDGFVDDLEQYTKSSLSNFVKNTPLAKTPINGLVNSVFDKALNSFF